MNKNISKIKAQTKQQPKSVYVIIDNDTNDILAGFEKYEDAFWFKNEQFTTRNARIEKAEITPKTNKNAKEGTYRKKLGDYDEITIEGKGHGWILYCKSDNKCEKHTIESIFFDENIKASIELFETNVVFVKQPSNTKVKFYIELITLYANDEKQFEYATIYSKEV